MLLFAKKDTFAQNTPNRHEKMRALGHASPLLQSDRTSAARATKPHAQQVVLGPQSLRNKQR